MQKILTVLLTCLLLSGCVVIPKTMDNLPSLEAVQNESLSWAEERLDGYERRMLIALWGEPDKTDGTGEDCWYLENGEMLILTYDFRDRVNSVSFAIE